MAANGQYRLEGALGDDEAGFALGTVLDHNGEALADEVIRNLIHFDIARNRQASLFTSRNDGLIKRIFNASFHRGIEICHLHNISILLASQIKCRRKCNRAFGQGSGLVGAEYIHAA